MQALGVEVKTALYNRLSFCIVYSMPWAVQEQS